MKLVTPDLGELLVMLCFASKITWEEISVVFLQEFYDRLVLWMLDRNSGNRPELAYLEKDEISEYRLEATYRVILLSISIIIIWNDIRY